MAKSAPQAKRLNETARKRILAARKAALTRLARKKEEEAVKKANMLVEQYMPYATSIANRVSKSLSLTSEYEDIICNARLGLLEAAKRFNDCREIDFKTFAYYRIKGAIFDGLRKTGWLPRSVYSRLKFEEASNDYLRQLSEEARATSEVHTEKDVSDTINTLASIYVISLDANEELDVEDTSQEDLQKRAEYHQIRSYMREAISSLPQKEKQLIMMYYFQNKTLEEAGDKLELSKSWVSRMHARALEMLLKRVKVLADKGNGDKSEVRESVNS